MKTKVLKYFLPLGLGLTLSLITMMGLVLVTLGSCDTEQCTDKDYPLWCSSAEKCCGADTPYNDSHGTCWGSLDACRATGYSCEHCWEE